MYICIHVYTHRGSFFNDCFLVSLFLACLFVCLFVCTLVCLFLDVVACCLSVCLFVQLLICVACSGHFVCLVCLFVWFVCPPRVSSCSGATRKWPRKEDAGGEELPAVAGTCTHPEAPCLLDPMGRNLSVCMGLCA